MGLGRPAARCAGWSTCQVVLRSNPLAMPRFGVRRWRAVAGGDNCRGTDAARPAGSAHDASMDRRWTTRRAAAFSQPKIGHAGLDTAFGRSPTFGTPRRLRRRHRPASISTNAEAQDQDRQPSRRRRRGRAGRCRCRPAAPPPAARDGRREGRRSRKPSNAGGQTAETAAAAGDRAAHARARCSAERAGSSTRSPPHATPPRRRPPRGQAVRSARPPGRRLHSCGPRSRLSRLRQQSGARATTGRGRHS